MNRPADQLTWVEQLLKRLLPPDTIGASIIGDLREEFVHDTRSLHRTRYLAAVISLAVRYGIWRVQGAGGLSGTSSRGPDRGRRWLVAADLRQSWRGLRRHPGFAFTGIGLLALGLAAATTVFSFVNAVLLRPLPQVTDLDRVVRIEEQRAKPGWNGFVRQDLTMDDMRRIAAVAPSFSATAATASAPVVYLSDDGAQRIPAVRVTSGFFSVVGTKPMLGRPLTSADEVPGAPPVAVLSYGAWQRFFGGSSAALGVLMRLGDGTAGPYQIVGVMPNGFAFPNGPDLYLPMVPSAVYAGFHVVTGLARLHPDATVARAEIEVSAAIALQQRDEPRVGHGIGARVISWRAAYTESVRPALRILSLAAVLVLLLSAINLGGLLTTRTAERARELAVRQSLGATRGRIVRLLLAEGILLGLGGAVLGAVLTTVTLQSVVALSPADLPFRDAVQVDWRVLGVAGILAVVVGLAAGIIPALIIDRSLALRSRWGASASAGRNGRRLVVVQLAMATMLVTGGTLLARSFARAIHVPAGVRVEGVLTAGLSLPSRYNTGALQQAFFQAVVDSLRTRPDVEGAELGLFTPLGGALPASVTVDAYVGEKEKARLTPVSPGYLPLLRVPLLSGRGLEPRDDNDGSERVAVINRTGAAALWPHDDPIGHTVYVYNGTGNGDEDPYRIVGVVADAKQESLLEPEDAPIIYVPFARKPFRAASLVIVSRGDPLALLPVLRTIVRDLDPTIPVNRVQTLASALSQDVAQPRFFAVSVGIFSVLALGLAIVGLYAVVAFAVRARLFEFGVRLALGATAGDNLRLVLRQGMMLCLLGTGAGLLLAIQATHILRAVLFHTEPTDPIAFSLAAAIVFGGGLLAILTPAVRASRADPVRALRHT